MKNLNHSLLIIIVSILLILSCSGQTDNQSNNSDNNNNDDNGSSKNIISSDDDYEPIPDEEFETTSSDSEAGNRYAVVVGVQDYSSSPNFNDLTFTLGDAVRMSKVYESQGAFDVSLFIDKYDLVEVEPDDPAVMKSEDYVPQYKKVYTNKDDGTLPYRDNILESVRQSVDAIYRDVYDNKNDANKHFLFYFSGHGLKFEGENYLILKGFGEASSEELQTNAISREELQEMIHSIRDEYREKVEAEIRKIRKSFSDERIEKERIKRYPENVSINLIFDACRTNESFKNIVNSEQNLWEFDDQPTKGIAVMYSTESGKVSIETPSLGSGVFTYFFEKALLGLADIESKYSLRLIFERVDGKQVFVEEINKKVLESFGRGDNDGYVTLNEAYSYVNNAMLEWGVIAQYTAN